MHIQHPPPCPPSCTHCLAYDNVARTICSLPPSLNSKWCRVHEELQAKLLKTYKRLTVAFESFDASSLPSSVEDIVAEQDLSTLREWSESARHRWLLARRVIVARADHHAQFYAGGDWGHCRFVETVRVESARMERFLRTLDRQAYSADLDAYFSTLEPPANPPTSRDLLRVMRNYLVPPNDLPSTVPPAIWTTFIEVLIRHVILRVPALATLALAAPSSPERVAALPKLPGKNPASLPSSITQFLDLLESRLAPSFVPDGAGPSPRLGDREVELLWRALKFARNMSVSNDSEPSTETTEGNGLIGVGLLADALDVVFRDNSGATSGTSDVQSDGQDQDQSITILGGRLYKSRNRIEWPRHGWDLFYQLVACPGCSLIATHSLMTWTTNRRLAALGHFPAWSGPSEWTAERIFRLTGVVLCTSNSCAAGKKVKRVEQKGSSAKTAKRSRTVFIEEVERSWMYIKLPIGEQRSGQVLNHLASLPDRYVVLARRTATDEITHSPPTTIKSTCDSGRDCSCCKETDVWLNRVRSGYSPVERKAARWTTTSFFPRSTVLSSLLKSSSPESRIHDAPFDDTFDAVILDATPGVLDKWDAFANSVADSILHAQGCESIGQLLHRDRDAAIQRGEMQSQEWDALNACATPDQRRGRNAIAEEKGSKVAYVCEDALTARRIFREE